MKILFFTVVVFFIAGFGPVKAQGTARPIKFIENIQIVPDGSSGESVLADKKSYTYKRKAIETSLKVVSGNAIEKLSAIQFKYGLILDEEVEDISNLKLYDFIDNWMDTHYRFGGTSEEGIDCSAFSSKLENTVYGLTLPRTAKMQYDACEKISRDDLQEGDLVFFNTRGGVSHVGVYLRNSYFVHSSIRGVAINSLNDDYYNRKFIKGGRIPSNIN